MTMKVDLVPCTQIVALCILDGLFFDGKSAALHQRSDKCMALMCVQGSKGAQDPQLQKQTERLGKKMTAPKSFPRCGAFLLEGIGTWVSRPRLSHGGRAGRLGLALHRLACTPPQRHPVQGAGTVSGSGGHAVVSRLLSSAAGKELRGSHVPGDKQPCLQVPPGRL